MGYMDNNQRRMLLLKGTGKIIWFKEHKLEALNVRCTNIPCTIKHEALYLKVSLYTAQ